MKGDHREHAGVQDTATTKSGARELVSSFDYDQIDTLPARLKEWYRTGDCTAFREMVEDAENEHATEAITRLLAIMVTARKPRMLAQQILWATGHTAADGLGLKELAKQNKVSKQAFQQGARNLFVALGLDMTPSRRSLDAACGRNTKHSSKGAFSIAAWAQRCERWLAARQHEQPIRDWPAAQRAAIRATLRPIVEVYDKL